MKQMGDDSNKGLASAGEETKERVAREGGKAHHEKRGLQAPDEDTREEEKADKHKQRIICLQANFPFFIFYCHLVSVSLNSLEYFNNTRQIREY